MSESGLGRLLDLLADDARETLFRELRICARSRLARTCKDMTTRFLPRELRWKLAKANCFMLAEAWLGGSGVSIKCPRGVLKRLCESAYARDENARPGRNVIRSLAFDLIRCKVNSGFSVRESRTILHTAADEGDVELVEQIVHGANPGKVTSIVDWNGRSALTHSCVKSAAVAILLVKHFKWPENRRERFTPLYMTCCHWPEVSCSSSALELAEHGRRRELCNLILQRQPDSVSRPCEKKSPLHDAGCAEAVRLLLMANADPNARTPRDSYPMACVTPLHALVQRVSRTRCLRNKHPDEQKDESLALAEVNAVGLLLEAGADVEAVQGDGCTPLLLAAREGLADVARKLVVDGSARPGVVCVEPRIVRQKQVLDDRTALVFAASRGHAATVRALLQSCAADAWTAAGTEAACDFESTPRVIPQAGRPDGVRLYKSPAGNQPASVLEIRHRRREPDVFAALVVAAEHGFASVVQSLVEEGRADLEGLGEHSRQVLRAAEEAGCEGVVKLLAQAGQIEDSGRAEAPAQAPSSLERWRPR